MFQVNPVTVKVLGQELQVKPLAVSKLLEIKDRYSALGNDDVKGILKLMTEVIITVVITPKLTEQELDAIGASGLHEVFEAIAGPCGLADTKKENADKTI